MFLAEFFGSLAGNTKKRGTHIDKVTDYWMKIEKNSVRVKKLFFKNLKKNSKFYASF